METGALKSFGTWARTALIREVGARVAAVLAPASPERVEQPKGVAALEKAIGAAGGGEAGRAAVVDRVAYTWFNRLVALRFMDANGYTGAGVVSPGSDSASVGQPEILAEAKRGVIDSDVVSSAVGTAVSGLLNGTRRSAEPQAEAYGLLLAEYCRYWNRFMPFMFERAGDFTELLMPANLLADDSVLNRAVEVLTEDACQDVEVIGWLYQFYIAERKDEVFAGFKKNKKAGADEIPAATQLFTPHWIVRYLVENSLGRLWMLNHPSSRLIDQMDYYITPVDEESDFLKIGKPEELKVIDPACGSGHMLTYAFDLLYAIYEEEGYSPSEIPGLILANNLYGVEIDPRAGALAAFALTMKARARQRTFFSKATDPNVLTLEPISFTPQELEVLITPDGDRHQEICFWNQFHNVETLGSLVRPDRQLAGQMASHLIEMESVGDDLISQHVVDRAQRVVAQAEVLSKRYAVAVANPPYMTSDNMGETLKDFAQIEYPDTKLDLFAMFIERCRSLVVSKGLVGMITMNSWMYLKTFESIRRDLLFSCQITSLIDLGAGAFPFIQGQVVSAAAFTLLNISKPRYAAFFVNATRAKSALEKETVAREAIVGVDAGVVSVLDPSIFAAIPGAQLLIAINSEMLKQFSEWKNIGDHFEARAGISTGQNGKFIRFWFEVDRSSISTSVPPAGRWKLHNKGGGGERRWYGNLDYVLLYNSSSIAEMESLPGFRHDGKDHYYRPHVGWSKVSTKEPAFRYYPEGMTFDSGGLGLFSQDRDELFRVLLYLNSPLARSLIKAVSPTLNLSPGQISALPVPPLESVQPAAVESIVERIRESLENSEPIWGFSCPSLLNFEGTLAERVHSSLTAESHLTQDLAKAIREMEDCAGWSLDNDDEPLGLLPVSTPSEFVADLISYAVGCMFGRYSLDQRSLVLADQGSKLQDFLNKVPQPSFMPDRDNVIPVVDGDWFEDDIVERFRHFLRVAFGDEHFEENLGFVLQSLGVRDLRDYFVKSFYKDHVQRYKKRPIYWLFSSPKGSFNALIYMHRYNSSTVSTVLNEYLREFKAKLQSSLQLQDRLAAGEGSARQQAAAVKEADRIRSVLLELNEYEDQILYPLALKQIEIDLDDGVKINYARFGAALKKIPGLEAAE